MEVRGTNWGEMSAMKNDPPTPIATPRPTRHPDRRARFGSPIRMDALRAMIGLMRGAISIAPITTAVESATTPKVAIAVAKLINAANCRVPSLESHPSKMALLTCRRRFAGIDFCRMTPTTS